MGGSCIVATPHQLSDLHGFSEADRREFRRVEGGRFVRVDGRTPISTASTDLFVHHLVAI